jgi:hypothetical protein
MFNVARPDRDLEGLSARLIIAAALNDLRRDPEAFARLLLALARVKEVDVEEIAGLLSRSGLAVHDDAGRSPMSDLPTVTASDARPARGIARGLAA